MARMYYQLREFREGKDGEDYDRRIWTFDNEEDANDAYEFFVKKGVNPIELCIEMVEVE